MDGWIDEFITGWVKILPFRVKFPMDGWGEIPSAQRMDENNQKVHHSTRVFSQQMPPRAGYLRYDALCHNIHIYSSPQHYLCMMEIDINVLPRS
jgi:hypothetical protein